MLSVVVKMHGGRARSCHGRRRRLLISRAVRFWRISIVVDEGLWKIVTLERTLQVTIRKYLI
jgi:hypothetical protein